MVPDRRQGRADRHADRRRLSGDRSDVVRLAEMGAADGRRGRGHGAHPPQARRALSGADAEPRRASRRRCAAGADEVAVFVAATEIVFAANINCSIAESLERAQPVFDAAQARTAFACAATSRVVLGCPYEGDVDPAAVARCRRSAARDGRLRGFARRHDRHRDGRQDAGAVPPRRRARSGRRRSPAIFTTRTARRSPTSTRRSSSASRRSTARSRGSAAARMPRARPATSRAKTSSTCSTGSASRPAST